MTRFRDGAKSGVAVISQSFTPPLTSLTLTGQLGDREPGYRAEFTAFMHLNDHSLRQIDDAYVRSLDPEALCGLSLRLLADLKEVRERLNKGPTNSSRPPSSRAPWDRGETVVEPDEAEACSAVAAEPAEATAATGQAAAVKAARKAGKQPGAPGVGRTQVFTAQEEIPHHPDVCAGCEQVLADPVGAVAYTGFQAVDLRRGAADEPGLRLWMVDHRYYEAPCACGHHTRATAGRGEVDPLLAGVELSEWRVVGPGLAGLIVALSLRFRLSRARIQEFLREWLGVELSIGTIHQTLHEAAAALAPAEDEWVDAVLASGLLHADETSWPKRGQPLWLWVFTAATVTLYSVAGRGNERVENVLEGFTGWLMSDGWVSYRGYPRRLRCWAHLIRKARGWPKATNATCGPLAARCSTPSTPWWRRCTPRGKARPPTSRPNTPASWPNCAPPASSTRATRTPRPTPWRWNSSTTGTRSSRSFTIPNSR